MLTHLTAYLFKMRALSYYLIGFVMLANAVADTSTTSFPLNHTYAPPDGPLPIVFSLTKSPIVTTLNPSLQYTLRDVDEPSSILEYGTIDLHGANSTNSPCYATRVWGFHFTVAAIVPSRLSRLAPPPLRAFPLPSPAARVRQQRRRQHRRMLHRRQSQAVLAASPGPCS